METLERQRLSLESFDESTESWMNRDGTAGLVSVIVPTFNRRELLELTLESVKKQTYRPIELLVVNDGSTDKTDEFLKRWQIENSDSEFSIEYYEHENQGLTKSRNFALEHCKGEFIQFLDSDDLLHPHKLSTQVAILNQRPEAEFVLAKPVVFYGDVAPDFLSENTKDAVYSIKDVTYEMTFPGCPHHHLYRRESIRKTGPWDESLKRWVDWEYCSRQVAKKARWVRLDRHPYYARFHSGHRMADMYEESIGVSRGIQSLERVDLWFSKMDSPPNPLLNAVANQWLSLARLSMAQNDKPTAMRCLGRALQLKELSGVGSTKTRLLSHAVSLFGAKTGTVLFRLADKVRVD
jgi:glycosyltransferase involved in cell wall biosynthesis